MPNLCYNEYGEVISLNKKKVLVWTLIILIAFFIPAIFMKQFFNLDNMVTIPTINYGDITMPGLIAGGISFWGMILIIWGIGNAGYDGFKFIRSKLRQKKETA